MAGYLSMSVPFLAFGLMFGASRFAHLATSMLAPTQRAAGTAAEEGTSGNINLANTSMDNHSFYTMRGNSMQTNAMIDSGMVSNRMGDGAMNHRTADGGESVFKDRALSDPGFNVSWGSRVSQGLQERSSEARSHAVTQGERASESMGASMGQSLAFSNSLQNSEGFNRSEGLEQRQVIANSASNIEQASERLSETTGWSQQQSLRMLGRATLDVGTPLKSIFGSGFSAQGSGEWSANGASKDDWATVQGIAKEYGVRESFENLDAASQNLSFSEGQSQLRDQRDSMNASHSESQSAEKSLNESLSQARSYEQALTSYKEDSGSFYANLNQMALEIGAERHGGNMAEAYQASKADPRVAQGWADEAIDRYLDKMPVGDKTPGSLMGDIYGSRGAEGNLRHDINREDITTASSQPDNQINEIRTQVTGGGKSLGNQMTNGSAKVGNEVQSSRTTTGKETAQKSNQSLPEGAVTAVAGNPGDAIDEVKKWFGTDDKKPGKD